MKTPNYKLPVYLPVLTSLRGAAALYVIFFHFQGMYDLYLPFWSKGYLAVDFFFLLSGFVMCHVYGNQFSRPLHRAEPYFRFLWARLARIYPLHIFMLLLMFILEVFKWVKGSIGADGHTAFTGSHSIATLIANLFLVQAFIPFGNWNGPSWSISSEWWLYVIFPWLFLLLNGLGWPSRLGWVGISFGLLAWFLIFINDGWLHIDTNVGLGWVRCVLEFPLGCFAYFAVTALLKARKGFIERNYRYLEIIYSYLFIALLVMLFLKENDVLIVAMQLIVLMMCLMLHSGWLNKLLSCKPLHYLGEISYSAYLVHLPIFKILNTLLPLNTQALSPLEIIKVATIWSMVVVAVSSVTYYFIEKPCRTFMNAHMPGWIKGRTSRTTLTGMA